MQWTKSVLKEENIGKGEGRIEQSWGENVNLDQWSSWRWYRTRQRSSVKDGLSCNEICQCSRQWGHARTVHIRVKKVQIIWMQFLGKGLSLDYLQNHWFHRNCNAIRHLRSALPHNNMCLVIISKTQKTRLDRKRFDIGNSGTVHMNKIVWQNLRLHSSQMIESQFLAIEMSSYEACRYSPNELISNHDTIWFHMNKTSNMTGMGISSYLWVLLFCSHEMV